jgi:hypothetical protein
MSYRPLSRIAAAGGAALILSSAVIGPASAQTAPAAPTPTNVQQARHEHGGKRAHLAVVATALGITPEQLRQELPGKSLAQVAQAHGKTPEELAAALKAAANQRIDQRINEVVPVTPSNP